MPEVAASLGPPKLEQVLSYFRRHRGREYAAVRGAHWAGGVARQAEGRWHCWTAVLTIVTGLLNIGWTGRLYGFRTGENYAGLSENAHGGCWSNNRWGHWHAPEGRCYGTAGTGRGLPAGQRCSGPLRLRLLHRAVRPTGTLVGALGDLVAELLAAVQADVGHHTRVNAAVHLKQWLTSLNQIIQ